ncbi:MAG: CHAT domain-containing protein [Limnohabitans sp.]|nr:CHAT domain-containing protein [Limnohabitans sp.]
MNSQDGNSSTKDGLRREAAHEEAHAADFQPQFESQCVAFETLSVADPAKAVETYETLWNTLVEHNAVAHAVRITRAAIQSLAHLGNTARALHIAARARRLASREHSRDATVEAARVLVAAMHPRAKRGNLRGSMRCGLRAARELEALGEDALVARAELNLANVAKALGQPARAAELLERVLARGAAIEAVRGAALNALGEARVQSGAFTHAVEAFEATARFYDAQGGALHSALARGNVAHTLAKAGDIEGALRVFRRAREQFAHLGAHAEGCRLAIEEAELLEDTGLLDDAADLIDDARILARRHDLRTELARTALISGRVELLRGQAMKARPAIDEAISVASSISDRITLVHALVAKSACLAVLGHLARAREAANEARAIAETPFEQAVALIALVERDPSATAATAWANEAIEIARALGLPALEVEATLASASAASHAQRAHDALRATRHAITLLESAQDKLAVSRLRRSFLSHRRRAYSLLAAQLIQDQASVSQALDAIEHARHRAILEALLEKPSELQRLHDDHALDAHETRVEVIAEFARARRKAERNELDARVEHALVPSSHPSRYERNARPQCASLVFFEHGDAIDVIHVPPSGNPTVMPVAGERAPIRKAQLQECIGRFRFQIARYLAGGASTRSTHVARTLFEELREHLFGRLKNQPFASISDKYDPWNGSCVIVPCDSIAGLPLCTLVPSDMYAAVAPSLGIAALLDANNTSLHAESRKTRTNLVVSVHDDATPGFAREGARVAHALGANTLHLHGEQATRALFRDALTTADTAHIACHGLFPPTAPNLAGLRLSDGWFGAHHAHALERAPRELVLSGCSTGLAADGAGEQWFGLVRGFAARGTARVLASLWPVVDRDAEAFMDALYAMPAVPSNTAITARAMRIAREQLAQGAHPGAAAAWTVVGGATAFLP